MKRCAIQQNAMSGCEEVKRNSISVSDRMDSLVCPKPRRLGVASPSINDHFRSLRYHVSHQTEICESKAGTELLDIILSTVLLFAYPFREALYLLIIDGLLLCNKFLYFLCNMVFCIFFSCEISEDDFFGQCLF